MAYPISGNYETRTPGTTIIKAAWGDTVDANITSIIGGSKSIKSLWIDGNGNVNSAVGSGAARIANGLLIDSVGITVTAGNVLASNGVLQTLLSKSKTHVNTLPYPAVANGQIALESVANGWIEVDNDGATIMRGFNVTDYTRAGAGNITMDFTGPFTDPANVGIYWSVNGSGDLVTAECTASDGTSGKVQVVIQIYKWTTPAGVLTRTNADYRFFVAVVGK